MANEENQDLQKKVEDQQKVIEDYINVLKRLQAEFENYSKRVEKEKEEFTNYANHKLVCKLLTVADEFDKAIENVKIDDKFFNGVELIHKNFHKVLKEAGLTKINCLGEKLDPFKHEVIDLIQGEKDDVIIEELQKGYMFKDKVLRPSKVKISKVGGK